MPWTTAHQASLSITNSQSLLKLMSFESVMPSNHLVLCHPLLLPPSIFPSIRIFSNESALHIRWPKYWSFSFSISPATEYSGLIPFLTSPISQWRGGAQLPPLLPAQVSLPFQILLIKQRPPPPQRDNPRFLSAHLPMLSQSVWTLFGLYFSCKIMSTERKSDFLTQDSHDIL